MHSKGTTQLQLGPSTPRAATQAPSVDFGIELSAFHEFGTPTTIQATTVCHGDGTVSVPTFINEFWTAKQRAAHSLHEVSYRACFKPQLPRFFIERLTKPGDVVYD